MNKNIFTLFLAMFVLIILASQNVSSAPPFSTAISDNGLEIRAPGIDVLKTGQDYNFPIHVFNISNGVYITSNTTCYMHLYNSSSYNIITLIDTTVSQDFDYNFMVTGGNFTTGFYFANFQCNTTGLGGGVRYDFQVSNSGISLTSPQALIYGVIFLFTLCIFLALFIPGILIDASRKTNIQGLMEWNGRIYLKIFVLMMSDLAFLFLTFISWRIAYYFLPLDFISPILRTIFITNMVITPIIIIVGVIIVFVLILFDKNARDLMARGINPNVNA